VEHKNFGLLIDPIVIGQDYVLGGYGDLDGEVLQKDGQWDDYLPRAEVQNLNGIEPYACVTFSTLNCIEILIRRQFGQERNYSDRFLATISGTAQRKGNSLQTVAETLRNSGVVKEAQWPFDYLIDTFDKFYAPVSDALRSLAAAFVAEFDYKHEYVPCNPSALKDALTKSPLNIATYAWALNPATGNYYKPTGYPDNHSPVLYGFKEGQYWKIFDSYDNTHKRMDWGTQFAQAKRHKLARQVVSEPWFKKFLNQLLAYFTQSKPESSTEGPSTPFPAPAPAPVPPTVPPTHEGKLETFCLAIRTHEGWFPGSRSQNNNNPGNCRYSSQGYLDIYKPVLKDAQNFARFKDYATGWLYLKNLVKVKINVAPNQTIQQFFNSYAPSSDGNDPVRYAQVVAAACGLKPTDPVSKILSA
jgi:hypothetical protein